MIARWRERTSIVSIQKHVDVLPSSPFREGNRESSPASFPHGLRVNQLESEPRSFCSLRIPRPLSLPCIPSHTLPSPAPLLGSSSSSASPSSSSSLPSLVFPSTLRPPWEKRLQTVNFRFPGRCRSAASNRLDPDRAPARQSPKLFRQ